MIIDELITILGFDIKDKDKLRQYEQSIGNAVDKLQTMAVVGTAAMGAMLAGITAVNSETAKMSNLADAVGMNADTANAFSSIANSIGLDTEHVVDLFEEMNNKVGESKAIYADWLKNGKGEGKELKLVGGFEDALKGLDLSAVDKSFDGLKLEEKVKKIFSMDSDAQYNLFTQAAAVAKDAQTAASSLDILMGGEANKIASALRNHLKEVGLTYSEWIQKKKELNFLDEGGVKGAKEYAKQVADTASIFGSITKQLSGLAGEYLAPILKGMNDWFRVNKKIIEIKLKEYVENIFSAFESLGRILKATWWAVDGMAKALGGWDVVLPILALIMAYFNPWKALIVGVMLVADDLFSYFSGGKSVVGEFIDYFKTEFPVLYSIIESIIGVWNSVFGMFKAIYDNWIKPLFEYFKSDSASASDSILSNFQGSFEGIGLIVKSFYEIVSTIFKLLTAVISGDFEAVKQYASELFSWIGNGFDGVVMVLTNGAATFRSVWADAIEWIMSKVEWVTNKIDSVKNVASEIGGDISDGISSAWDGAVNLFGGDKDNVSEKVSNSNIVEKINNIKESFTNNNTIEKTKEIVNNITHTIVQSPMLMNMAPTTAPVPVMAHVSNQHNYDVTNTHSNKYDINVSSVNGSPADVAEQIKNSIVNIKSIEKATVNKIKPIYKDK